LFQTENPFDLSTRSGIQAYNTASAALDEPWDGTPDNLPSFVIDLLLRSNEVGWNRPGVTNITTVNGVDILRNFKNVTIDQVTAAHEARVNPRAVQNSQTMYNCLKKSITGDIRTLVFQQFDALPQQEDGPLLFLKIITNTVSSSIQLAMSANDQLLNYDPSTLKFNIANINKRLQGLFLLAATPAAPFSEQQKLTYTLRVYNRIRQPESWATWCRNQSDRIEDGTVDNCQAFMTSAVLKQTKIIQDEGTFSGSLNTLSQDVIAMMAAHTKRATKPKAEPKTSKANADKEKDKDKEKEKPPFLTWTKKPASEGGGDYAVGDSKTWNDKTYYYCDAPTHRGGAHWHTHTAIDCNTRKRWQTKLATETPPGVAPEAHHADPDTGTPPAQPSDDGVVAMLGNVMTSLSGNDEAVALIADVLNVLEHGE